MKSGSAVLANETISGWYPHCPLWLISIPPLHSPVVSTIVPSASTIASSKNSGPRLISRLRKPRQLTLAGIVFSFMSNRSNFGHYAIYLIYLQDERINDFRFISAWPTLGNVENVCVGELRRARVDRTVRKSARHRPARLRLHGRHPPDEENRCVGRSGGGLLNLRFERFCVETWGLQLQSARTDCRLHYEQYILCWSP